MKGLARTAQQQLWLSKSVASACPRAPVQLWTLWIIPSSMSNSQGCWAKELCMLPNNRKQRREMSSWRYISSRLDQTRVKRRVNYSPGGQKYVSTVALTAGSINKQCGVWKNANKLSLCFCFSSPSGPKLMNKKLCHQAKESPSFV